MHVIVERAGTMEAERPPWLVRAPRLRTALLVAANLLGLFAFLWPFALPALVGSADDEPRELRRDLPYPPHLPESHI